MIQSEYSGYKLLSQSALGTIDKSTGLEILRARWVLLVRVFESQYSWLRWVQMTSYSEYGGYLKGTGVERLSTIVHSTLAILVVGRSSCGSRLRATGRIRVVDGRLYDRSWVMRHVGASPLFLAPLPSLDTTGEAWCTDMHPWLTRWSIRTNWGQSRPSW